MEGGTLHERLVAYVHALSDTHHARSGVWVEHSYARARGAASLAVTDARVLLAHAPRTRTDSHHDVDVERDDPPPPLPPDYRPTPADDDHDDDDHDYDHDHDHDHDHGGDDEDWEERAARHAPTAECARLVERVGSCLRAARLAVLAGRGGGGGGGGGGVAARREAVRASCRRLRAALAPSWAAVGAQPRAPAWLHATLTTHLPRGFRSLYEETVAELRRSAPRLAERMGVSGGEGGALLSPHESDAEGAEGAAVSRESSPWLVWLEAGGSRGRWARRLRSLVHTRAVPVESPAGRTASAWCAAAAGSARAALADVLAEAGERAVVLGGAGSGAALAGAVASAAGAGVRALVLVGPLGGAGGAGGEEPLAEVSVPVLAACARWGGGGGGGAAAVVSRGAGRRALLVRGADESLLVPPQRRSRLRLTQHALDAAVAEECVRWMVEVCEGDAGGGDVGGTCDTVHYHPRAASPERPASSPPRPPRDPLPPRGPLPSNSTHSTPRAIEIVEGRVVSRVCGATPLALVPPRRAPLAAADIMQMPIVFADDERARVVTVRSGAARGASGAARGASGAARGASGATGAGATPRYARVIVAKRGAAGRGVLLRRHRH